MGFKGMIARVFGGGRSASAGQGTPAAPPSVTPPVTHEPPGRPASEEQVMDIDADIIEAGDGSPDAAGGALSGPIKSRQELVNELKKNYSEVLEIVRKVDDHLDQTARRSDQMIEIAKDSAEQNRRMAEAMLQLVEMTRSGQEHAGTVSDRMTKTALQQLEATQQQTTAISKMQSAIHNSGEAERELAESVRGFTGELSGVSKATDNLGSAITAMRETDAEREKELATLVASSQRWLVLAVVACGVLAIGTLIVVLVQGL